MDRVHIALAPCKTNCPPRDIIAKFYYYRTKKQLLAAARGKKALAFQGYTYQMFADLSPLMVAKGRTLKPLLQILQRHQIPYHWGFFILQSLYTHGDQIRLPYGWGIKDCLARSGPAGPHFKQGSADARHLVLHRKQRPLIKNMLVETSTSVVASTIPQHPQRTPRTDYD